MPEPFDHRRQPGPKELSFTGPVRLVAFAMLGVAIGLATCFGLWLISGGWAPPLPMFFVGAGLAFGIVASFAKPAKRPPR